MRPTKGRIVIYSLDWRDLPEHYRGNEGKTRPALIVEVFANGSQEAAEGISAVNLQVFPDGPNDGQVMPFWKGSVLYSEAPGVPGTWSWPPRVA